MNKGKVLFWGLLVMAAATGSLYAQSVSGDFSSGSSFTLSPFQAQGGYPGGGYPGYDPAAYKAANSAGFQNMLFGLYSWKNKDIFGGVVTAGLEGGGLVFAVITFAMMASDPSFNFMTPFIGVAAAGGGAIFGMFRGRSLYQKLNTEQGSAAAAFGGNPLEHIDIAPVPTGASGGLGLALTYSTKF